MTEQPQGYYPPAPYPGQPGIPTSVPSHLLPAQAPQYFTASGSTVLWSTLLLIPAYTFSVFPGIWAILSLILLTVPTVFAVRGFKKTTSFAGATTFPIVATLLPLLGVAGTGLQDIINLTGSRSGVATTLTGYLMGALLLLSIIMLSGVAKHFPAVVGKTERLWSNLTVAAFAGSTASVVVMPLIVFMGMFVLVGGWLTYGLTVAPFILGIIGTGAYLLATKDKRKVAPGKLLELSRILPYSIIFACVSFVTAASVVFGIMVNSFPSL